MNFSSISQTSIFYCFLIFYAAGSHAQVTDIAKNPSIHNDSTIIIDWATGCQVKRGLMNIAEPELGFASLGQASSAEGPAGESGVVSLGDGGEAVLTFKSPIIDHDGPDLAVFENSFDGQFLEFAFVEVSSDGINYYRFPSVFLGDTTNQIGTHDPSNPHEYYNLAGQYPIQHGTAFDLFELKDIDGLDIKRITHVKVIDVVGTLINDYASRSATGAKINDPWPTPFASSGFDLDAVAVLKSSPNAVSEKQLSSHINIFPNIASAGQTIKINSTGLKTFEDLNFRITNNVGTTVVERGFHDNTTIETNNFEKGIYHLLITSKNSHLSKKLIIQ